MTDRMPVAFIGHGSPMNALDRSHFTEWRDWGTALPRPKAVLVVSAHWEDTPVSIGSTTRHNKLVYDFYGFPDHMYDLKYPAPGAPGVADRIESLLSPHLTIQRTDRGLDHGGWVPLMHLLPQADVPVLQISMPMTMTEEELFLLGRELSPLRDEGVLILGTGNLTHNLREAFRADPSGPPPEYAVAFDSWVAASLINGDSKALQSWQDEAPEAFRSHPSAEHYRPILVTAGAAASADVGFPIEGFELGLISRRSVHFD